MKPALLFGIFLVLFAAPAAQGASVRITSPERHQTWAYSSHNWKRLLYDKRRNLFQAWVQFTNQEYVLKGERVERENAYFPLPGIRYDAANRVFYAVSGGKRVPVAVKRDQVINTSIEPLPTTRIIVSKSASGLVTVTLEGSTDPARARPGHNWIFR